MCGSQEMWETRRALMEYFTIRSPPPHLPIATAKRLPAMRHPDDGNRTQYSELRDSGKPENAPPRPVLRTRVRTNGRNTRRIKTLKCRHSSLVLSWREMHQQVWRAGKRYDG